MGYEYYEGIAIMCDNCREYAKEKAETSSAGSMTLTEEIACLEAKLKKKGWIFEEDAVFCCEECKKEKGGWLFVEGFER